MELTSVIHDTSPDAEASPAGELPPADPLPSPQELLMRAGINNAMQPQRFAEFIQRAMPDFQRLSLTPPRNSPPATTPRTRFSGTVTAHRVVENRSFDLAEMRRIKSVVPGATINDAVLAIVAGALRRYLDSKGELPTERLVVMAPISIRDPSDKGAMATGCRR